MTANIPLRALCLLLAAASLTGSALAQAGSSAPAGRNHASPFAVAGPPENPTTPAKVELGRFLFDSPLLSSNRKIACSTCHDPSLSFADGMAESRGVFETEVGRNSPTLLGIGMHPGFLGQIPTIKPGSKKIKPAPQLTLEERCLSPIENPIEMGSSVKEAVKTLKQLPGMKKRFDAAFGKRGVGVNGDRIGKAIAAFLRTCEVPESPYRSFKEGEVDALSPEALRGLSIFQGRGKCAECHAGPYLTDGRIHIADTFGGFRTQQQLAKARTRLAELSAQQAKVMRTKEQGRSTSSPLAPKLKKHKVQMKRLLFSPPSGYGGGNTIQVNGVQTPTLWDVARTGPWFRDGSVDNLEIAVRQHVEELAVTQRVSSGMPDCGVPAGVTPAVSAQLIPKRLRSLWATVDAQPKPPRLNTQEITDLMAFLKSLSASD